MSHSFDERQVVSVEPPLDVREAELVAGLAGAGPGPRRVWPGQPGRRSPWVPCPDGCCLVLESRSGADPVEWLRFLVRDLLAPQARVPRERAHRLGLPGGHRLDGEVPLAGVLGPRLLVAVGRRVRVVPHDEEPGSGRPPPRRRGEVVRLDASPGQSTER